MREDPSGNYYLTNDIVLTEDFFPIAPNIGTISHRFEGTPFTGIFDGGGYTISNLRIDMPDREYADLSVDEPGASESWRRDRDLSYCFLRIPRAVVANL